MWRAGGTWLDVGSASGGAGGGGGFGIHTHVYGVHDATGANFARLLGRVAGSAEIAGELGAALR